MVHFFVVQTHLHFPAECTEDPTQGCSSLCQGRAHAADPAGWISQCETEDSNGVSLRRRRRVGTQGQLSCYDTAFGNLCETRQSRRAAGCLWSRACQGAAGRGRRPRVLACPEPSLLLPPPVALCQVPFVRCQRWESCCLFKITSVQRNAASKPAEPQIHASAAGTGSAWFNSGPQPCRRSPEPPEALVLPPCTWKGRPKSLFPASRGPAAGPAPPGPTPGVPWLRGSFRLAATLGFRDSASPLSPCPLSVLIEPFTLTGQQWDTARATRSLQVV